MSNIQRKKYTHLTISQRLEILQKLEEGLSPKQLADQFDVTASTVYHIKKNEAKLRKKLQTKPSTVQKQKKLKDSALGELDTRLYVWYLEQRATGIVITDHLLQEKAIELNAKFGGPSTFTCSRGWIWRFKNRHDIRSLNDIGETKDIDHNAAEEFSKALLKRLEEEEIDLENVYNMDETGLAWKALPPQTWVHSAETNLFGVKTKRDLVTIAFCTNVTGTHKLPPLFIYKSERPRALKHCYERLPVIYKAQERGRMDQNVFVDWLDNHFIPLVCQYQRYRGTVRKVLLIVDNCVSHILPTDMLREDNFEIVYLPSGASMAQPMEQGIISRIKISFRHKIIKKLLSYSGGLTQFYTDYDIKDCIDILYESWLETKHTYIKNCWEHLVGIKLAHISQLGVKEEPEEETDDISETSSLTQMLETFTGASISEQEVKDWLTVCEKEERKDPVAEKAEEESQHVLQFNEDDVARSLSIILAWSKQQEDFIQSCAQVMKDYFDRDKK